MNLRNLFYVIAHMRIVCTFICHRQILFVDEKHDKKKNRNEKERNREKENRVAGTKPITDTENASAFEK